MNQYDIKLQRQKDMKEFFDNSKSNQEREIIEPIRKKFMSRIGVSKKEYSKLIKYYTGVEIEDNLIYDIYRYTEVEKEGMKISFISMDKRELKIYNTILKACFVLG